MNLAQKDGKGVFVEHRETATVSPHRCLVRVLVCVGVFLSLSLVDPAFADARRPARVRLLATLACVEGGGAEVTLIIRNMGRETVEIQGDLHLTVTAVGPGGREPVAVLFVFPAPDFRVIPPGGEQTFIIPVSTADEGGQPGSELRARRLLLEVEVFFAGDKHPTRRQFSFPGCS